MSPGEVLLEVLTVFIVMAMTQQEPWEAQVLSGGKNKTLSPSPNTLSQD